MSRRERVVFMGSPDFATPSLEALAGAGYEIALVVTQPDRPAGRGGHVAVPPVKRAAEALGVRVLQPETLKDEAVQAQLRAEEADLFVVAAYGKILPRAVLALPRLGCINVHGSLLPRWRGASPIAAAILAGDTETGISIMEMAPKMDAGPVISRVATAIGADDTTGTLDRRLAELGARELVRVLPGWIAGEVRAEPQDESLVTFCHTLTKADGQIAATMPAEQAARAVRAFTPWPGAFVTFRGERLAIWKAHAEPGASGEQAGHTRTIGKLPAFALAGGWLVLDEVQKPGARRSGGPEYLNGLRGGWDGMVGLA